MRLSPDGRSQSKDSDRENDVETESIEIETGEAEREKNTLSADIELFVGSSSNIRHLSRSIGETASQEKVSFLSYVIV